MESDSQSADITGLLRRWASGDSDALNELTPKVYAELRRMARRYAAREQDHQLQATALVNEVYVRLIEGQGVQWQDRAHFFAVSAQMMRRILVDAARARASAKRGGYVRLVGESTSVNFDRIPDTSAKRDAEMLALDEALDRLGEMDPRKLRVVEMRFFAGLSADESAHVLDVSPQTIQRDWRLAKAWLSREIGRARPERTTNSRSRA